MPRTSSAERQPRSLRQGSPSLVTKAEALRIARESGLPWAKCYEVVKGLPKKTFGKRDKVSRHALATVIANETAIVTPDASIKPLSLRQLERLSG